MSMWGTQNTSGGLINWDPWFKFISNISARFLWNKLNNNIILLIRNLIKNLNKKKLKKLEEHSLDCS